MVGRLDNWLNTEAAGEDLARRGRLLNVLLLFSIAISVSICLLFLGIALFAAQEPIWPALGPPLVVALVSTYCLWLSKGGKVQTSIWLYIATLFSAIAASVLLFDGYPSNSMILFFWPIIVAGILLGPRHALSTAVGASLVGVSAAVLEAAGIYSPPIRTPESAYQLVSLGFNIIIFVSLALLMYLALRSFNHALKRERVLSRELKAHHAELEQRSAEMELMNAELQREVTERQRAELALQGRVRELDALQKTVLDITGPHDLPSLLQTIVVRATSLLDASGGGIYECDPLRDEVQCVVSYSTLQDYAGTVLAYGEGAAGAVAQTGTPLIIDDYGAWPGQAAAFKEAAFRAVIAVPMMWQDRVIGVLDIIHHSEDRRFDQGDLDLLGLLANHAAIAIENTRLYERVQAELAERMQAERETIERQLYLEGVLTAAPDAIVTLDSQHRVVEWNRGAERLFGYTPAETIGQNLDDLVTFPEVSEEAAGFTRTVVSGNELLPVETTRRRKDGSVVNVIVGGAPILIGGQVAGIVVVYTDITGRVRAEQELDGYRLDLETKVAERAAELVRANQDLEIEIAERARAEDRLTQINECFLGFGPDPLENINRLTALGGQLLGADCALYNRVEGGLLHTLGQWNTPPGFNARGTSEGHICFDVVERGDDAVLVFRDLLNSDYAKTVPRLVAHQLQTYMGRAVRAGNTPVGAFCVVYGKDVVPSESDRKLLGILASAVGVEEDRRQAEQSLRRFSERLQILYQIGQAILATESPRSLVEAGLEGILGLIPCTGAVVANMIAETQDVEISIVDNADDQFALPPGTRLPRTVFEVIENELATLQSGEVTFLDDHEIASRVPPLAPIFESRGVRTLLVLPLLVQETVIGVLALGTDVQGSFTSEHAEIAREIADLLALGIQQARLREQLQQHAEELEEQAGELARSNDELQQFAYVASHDLQEPLRMVTSYLQLLQKRYGGQLDSDADEFIGFAVDGATRMHYLIKDLLTYSRVSTHGGHIQSTDVGSLLRQTLENLQLAIEEKNATVSHDPMPTVMADPAQLSQLLHNLIGNALKFSGDRPPEVHISAQKRDLYWHFSVRDNGIGIDAHYADRIFVIFQRLHTRAEYPGTGIGLAICKRIVERHGGRIWFESVPGQGSTFYFTIPETRDTDSPGIMLA